MGEIRHIVNVSGGAASAVCLFRVLERFGSANIAARFADVNQENPDLYRFLDDVERVAEIPITRLNSGLDCWDVWMREVMLTNPENGGCLAAWHLKILALRQHAAKIASIHGSTIYLGLGPDEDDRIERAKSRSQERLDFPLTWRPKLSRCDVIDDLRARGIEPSNAYNLGYPHDNCGGACILAGIGQFAGLLRDNTARFSREEMKEQEFLAELRRRGRKEITILRDRRGGKTRNLSLRQLREELESGIRDHDDSWRHSSCSCMGSLFS